MSEIISSPWRQPTSSEGRLLLEVENLSVEFDTDDGIVRAVSDLSYTLRAGETLAILGESGSGKSVSVQALMGLSPRRPDGSRVVESTSKASTWSNADRKVLNRSGAPRSR